MRVLCATRAELKIPVPGKFERLAVSVMLAPLLVGGKTATVEMELTVVGGIAVVMLVLDVTVWVVDGTCGTGVVETVPLEHAAIAAVRTRALTWYFRRGSGTRTCDSSVREKPSGAQKKKSQTPPRVLRSVRS